jgi:hypothetical protein
MLIAKDGISREIDEKNLQVYKDKGYVPIEDKTPTKPPVEDVDDKPLEKMTVDELKKFATENGVNISGVKTKAEILEIILSNAPDEELKEG